MTGESTLTLTLEDRDEAVHLFGNRDQHLRLIRDAINVRLIARGDTVQIDGPTTEVDVADRVFQQLRSLIHKKGSISSEDVRTVLANNQRGDDKAAPPLPIVAALAGPTAPGHSRHLRPRTPGQNGYVQALKERDVVFAVGPAGSGKTYLAVGHAVHLLRQQVVKKIVLVRPAVEAGEKLGFLPGDIAAKVNPYLRPLLDALNDMMEPDQVRRYLDNDIIEIAPLAFMRGRTLNQAVIILDEGQNTTVPQMQMFLTRMGHGSKIIVTGDITQIDLPPSTRSGLVDALHRLKEIEGLAIVRLGENDIVRHPLVQRIVKAYEDLKEPRRPSEGIAPDAPSQ